MSDICLLGVPEDVPRDVSSDKSNGVSLRYPSLEVSGSFLDIELIQINVVDSLCKEKLPLPVSLRILVIDLHLVRLW